MTNRKTIPAVAILGLIFILNETGARADNKVWQTDGGVIAAKAIRFKKSTQEYIITLPNDQDTSLPKDKVKAVQVDKPAKYDQAATLFKSGAYDAAIPILDEMSVEYYMLNPWDVWVMDMLGTCYAKKNQPDKAAATYKKLFSNIRPTAVTPEMQRRFWDALVAIDDKSLARELESAIAKGTRDNAAAAHIARGDMLQKQGNISEALLDYLRVVLLYEQVKTLQPEALYKAAQCLDKLRDTRAEEFRKRLATEYGQSEWAMKSK